MSRESLANDRTIVIKKADKGSCIAVWDRNVSSTENIISKLSETCNKTFSTLKGETF